MECYVILLADAMEGFIKLSLEKYRLDPAHFNTSPGLSWSACGANQTLTPHAKANHEKFAHYDK